MKTNLLFQAMAKRNKETETKEKCNRKEKIDFTETDVLTSVHLKINRISFNLK